MQGGWLLCAFGLEAERHCFHVNVCGVPIRTRDDDFDCVVKIVIK